MFDRQPLGLVLSTLEVVTVTTTQDGVHWLAKAVIYAGERGGVVLILYLHLEILISSLQMSIIQVVEAVDALPSYRVTDLNKTTASSLMCR